MLASLVAPALVGALALLPRASLVAAQGEDEVIWHNRYHALLAMAVYGDYQTLCPQQTFTAAGLQPWTVLETFGPTAHGAEGFSAYLPEMNKVTIIFKGDYNLEKNLPLEQADLTALNLGDRCNGCKANAFALAGYLEAWEQTNGFAVTLAKWREVMAAKGDVYFSVTGHGLGGAHSILSTIHLGSQQIVTFSHNYGTPRVLNPAAAAFHDFILGGNQLDRGGANADMFMSIIPQSADYTFANTGVWYHGYNETFQMNSAFCYEQPEDPACLPQGDLNEQDHYFYFTNIGQCGGTPRQNLDTINAFIAQQQSNSNSTGATGSLPLPAAMTGTPIAVANATSSTTSDSATTASDSTATGLVLSIASSSAPPASAAASNAFGASNAATTPQVQAENQAAGAATGAGDNSAAAPMNAIAGSAVVLVASLAIVVSLL